MVTRLDRRFLANDSSHNEWLESESLLQNLQRTDWQTQFVYTERNELFAVICLSFFVESEPQAVRVKVESESCEIFSSWVRVESWLRPVESKNCKVIPSLWFISSSQCRVKWNLSFFLCLFLLGNGAQLAIKWHP